MILPAETLDSLVDALRRRDKATTEYNGFLIEVTSEADDIQRLTDDFDWYGTIELEEISSGRGQRPPGFTGAAEVVYRDRFGRTWWQPPADVARGSEGFTSLRKLVRGWYREEWHYVGIVVTVSRLCPCCHELREVATESLWGVESYASADYVAEVVRDLLADIETEDTADATH